MATLSWDLYANIGEEKQTNEQVSIEIGDVYYKISFFGYIFIKIRKVMDLNLDIVDVDGSYLYRKEQRLLSEGIHTVALALPITPLVGWECMDRSNFKDKNVPKVMPG